MATKKVKKETLKRARRFYFGFVFVAILILLRIVHIQFISSEISYNSSRLREKVFDWKVVPSHRGSILARDGKPLAISVYNYQVNIDYGSEGFDSIATFKAQSDSLGKMLSLHFRDKSAKGYSSFMQNEHNKYYKVKYRKDSSVLRSSGWFARLIDRIMDRQYKTIKVYDTTRIHHLSPILPREVDYTEWKSISHFPIFNLNMGLTYNLSQTDTRIYPQGELARRTIGKLMFDRGRDYGIEKVCSVELAAHPGRIRHQRIARGFYTQVSHKDNVEPRDGHDVVTTLDVDIQDVASRTLYNQLKAQRAIWGTTIVMEVETGDILAIANLGRTKSGDYVEDKNYAIGSRMEPGSTFKLASMLALLEVGEMSPDQIYDTGNGQTIRLGSAKVRDSHAGYSEVDLKTAVAQSLNGYFATAAYKHFNHQPDILTDYLRSLHLDRTIGLEEFGAKTPDFRYKGSRAWTDNNTVALLGYGYGIEITPLHTLTLYNAVANGGKMVAPRIIKEIKDGDRVIKEYPVRVLNDKICSNKTLSIVRECLEETAKTGTAKYYLGKFNDFTVAAKTGTAQFAQGGIKYGDGYYLGSMVTYMPADNPKYTILTAVFTKRGYGTTYYGAGLAGNVLKQVSQHLYNREMKWYDTKAEGEVEHYPTTIKGGKIEQIGNVTAELSPSGISHHSYEKWGRASTDSLSEVTIEEIDHNSGIMPNVVGMGLKDALYILESQGLRVSFSGEGRVRRQSVAAGRKIPRGTHVTITLN